MQSDQPVPHRVLIFGGTFDPPHIAHVELPQAAARELGCERVIYVLAAVNPLKAGANAAPPTPAHHRLAMLQLALQDVPNAHISTIELDRPGPSYTIDTLKSLVGWAAPTTNAGHAPMVGDAHPTAYLLIGADQALDFHRWKDWREILRQAMPAVMLRPPWTQVAFAAALRQRYGEDQTQRWLGWALKSLPALDVSATDIRSRIRSGQPVAGLIDPRVEAFIRNHGLYRAVGG